MAKEAKKIAVLGSTGSIGTQTLDIVAANPDLFKVQVITARRNWRLAAEQARRFLPRRVVMTDEEAYRNLARELDGTGIEVSCGADEIARAAAEPEVDTVVTALVGYSGLIPTLAAIEAGKTIALANKETLVVAGELVEERLKTSPSRILPVDSEHSAIFQCLNGEKTREAERIILTASGGPFRTLSLEQLAEVTVEQALKNPNWSMGQKVTIDSASMLNKGFEMIEAHWLFGCPADKIDIVVHPQSVVHSMVQFHDGSVMAQMAVPDMHLPIQYALGWPDRLPSAEKRLDLPHYGTLTFEKPDLNRFPMLRYAFDAINAGSDIPCVLNAANEIAVAAFLNHRIRFMQMPTLVRRTLDSFSPAPSVTLEQLIDTNARARSRAEEILKTL